MFFCFFLWAFIAFSFHFCHVWLKFSCFSTSRLFYSTSVLYLSTSVVFKKIQFPSCFFHLRYLLRAFTPPLPHPHPPHPQFQFSGIFLHCSAFDFSGHPRGTTGGFLKKLHEWCDKYVKSIYKCISFGFTELQFKCKGSYLCSTICQHIFNSPAWLLLFLLNVFLNWIFIEKLVFVASLKCHVLGVPT